MTKKELKNMADNTLNIKDEFVCRNFVYGWETDADITYDFGKTPVMICPMGEYTASTTDGKIVTENIDAEALQIIVKQTEEILVDRDHASSRPNLDKDTIAMGWLSDLKIVLDASDFSGLYGVINWTKEGREFVETRAYRFLSPTFAVDEKTGKILKLVSVALTNRPNFKMPPIINSEPDIKEKTMEKDDILKMINEAIDEKLEAMKAAVKSDEKDETAENKEEVKNDCGEEKTDEVKNDDDKDDKDDKDDEKDDEKEVVQLEALNSVVDKNTVEIKEEIPAWKKLHGKAFFDYINKYVK